MSDGLESYLRSHQAEGRLESQGSFTIDPREAQRKVAQFGLDGPDKGLLRLLQLAVASRCQKLEIKMARKTVEIAIHKPVGELFRLERVSEPVTTALLACLYAGFESGHLSDLDNSWELTRTRFERRDLLEAQPEVARIHLQRSLPNEFWGKLRALIEQRVEDTAALQERLRFCPVPVTLDCRPLNGGRLPLEQSAMDLYLMGPEEKSPEGVWCDEECGAWVTRYTFRDGQHSRPEDNPGKYWDTFETVYQPAAADLFGFAHTNSQSGSILAHLWVPMAPRGPGVIHLVRHGVIVGSHALDADLPVRGAVCASTLDVDISGLAAVNNNKVPVLVEKLIRELKKEIQGVLQRNPSPDVERRLQQVLKHTPKDRPYSPIRIPPGPVG